MNMYLYKEIIEYHNGDIKEIIPAWWTNRIFKSIRSVGAIYINGQEIKRPTLYQRFMAGFYPSLTGDTVLQFRDATTSTYRLVN